MLQQIAVQVTPRERRVLPYREGEGKPRRVGLGAPQRQHQIVLIAGESLIQDPEIALARRDERIQLRHLWNADRRLDIGHLEIVTDLGEVIAMVVGLVQTGYLPVEPVPTFTVACALVIAPTIAPPIPDGMGDVMQLPITGADGPTLARRDMMRRIEAERCKIAESTAWRPIKGAPQCITGILDHVESVSLCKGHYLIHLHRITEDVGHEDRPAPLGERCLQ